MREPVTPKVKRPYRTPVLVIYGVVTQLTRQVGRSGKRDGRGGGRRMHRTGA